MTFSIVHSLSSRFPVCPRCLATDPAPYERLAWSLHSVLICTEHHCWLISRCPACQKPFRSNRLDVVKCQCGASIADIEPWECSLSAARLAKQLHPLFLGNESPLAGISPAATCCWAERLAAAAARTPAWIEPLQTGWEAPEPMPDQSITWLAAAEMFQGWPKRFREFLGVYQEVSKYRSTSTGISRRFGLWIREAWQLEKLGFSTPADALREYLLESYSGGHLIAKVCLFQGDIGQQQLGESRWITLTEATRMLGLRHRAIAALVRRGVLAGRVHAAGARAGADGKGLNRLVLWQADLERCRPEIQAQFDRGRGYPLHRVGKMLFAERPVKVDVVKKWVGMRLLKAQRMGRARIITAEEMERFQATCCLAEEACRSLGISRTTLSRWEVEGRVRPVYGKRVTPGAGFSLYRREDIERLKSPESDRPVPTARAA